MHSKHRGFQRNHKIGIMHGSQNFTDGLEGYDLWLVVFVDQFSKGENDQVVFGENQVTLFDSAVREDDSDLKRG